MKTIPLQSLESWYADHREKSLFGQYIAFESIAPLIKGLNRHCFEVKELGTSEQNKPIYSVKVGKGARKILIWSQMHGNESTGTKAVFDLFRFFTNSADYKDLFSSITEKCTLLFVPMLNPDGAEMFVRENAHGIDLNRDAVALKAKESTLLRSLLDRFNPSFCFNLHDQRTIFNVSGTKNPASLSFLAPSQDAERTLTKGRTETMSVIASMYKALSELIPNHIGRYTDEFYPTATGDNFQKKGHNTVLIEAGHCKDDYDRETVRKFNFYALLQGLYFLSSTDDFSLHAPYFDIPNNATQCYDLIHRNVRVDNGQILDIAYQYEYQLQNKQLQRMTKEVARGQLTSFIGHEERDFKKQPSNA